MIHAEIAGTEAAFVQLGDAIEYATLCFGLLFTASLFALKTFEVDWPTLIFGEKSW